MNKDKSSNGVNPAAVGVVGALVGAAGAAAAIALSDKDNRKKLQKAIKDIKAEGTKQANQLKKTALQLKGQVSKKKALPAKSASKSAKKTKS